MSPAERIEGLAGYVTVPVAASELGITPRGVRRLIADGTIPAIRVGRDWLISEAAVTAARDRQKPGNPNWRGGNV